jgi:ubiquinone/menaquinone biosynthesis C-methylase UbiE
LAALLVDLAALQPGERVLDVACGTGAVARLAVHAVGPTGQVVGLDHAPAMLAVARTVPLPPEGAIQWQTGDAGALPFPEAVFDVVCCQQGLQFVPDRVAALREMHRVLVPGGRVVLGVWQAIEHNPVAAAFSAAVARYVSPEAGRRARAPFTLGDATVLHTLLTEAGFRDVVIRTAVRTTRFVAFDAYVLRAMVTSPLAAVFAHLEEPTRAALVREVGTALQAYRDGAGLALPIATHLVKASTAGA